MNRPLSRRRLRNTAFVVLLAWLFALASGVANACLLESSPHDLHISAPGAHGADSPTHSTSHPADGAAHGDGMHTASTPCQKVCDDTPQSLPKALSAVDQTNPGLPPPIVILWAAAAPVASGFHHTTRMQPAMPGLPIRLRYMRLAL